MKKFVTVSLCIALLVVCSAFNDSLHTETLNDLPKANVSGAVIGDMGDQQWAWAEPWAMWADKSGNCWMNESCKTFPAPLNDGQILIWKGGNGFTVDLHGSKFQWAKGQYDGAPGQPGCQPIVRFCDSTTDKVERPEK